MENEKVAVSERAIIQRINRKLAHENQRLCTARLWHDGPRAYENSNLGRYYIVDTSRNALHDSHVDLGETARELGILKPWEAIAE